MSSTTLTPVRVRVLVVEDNDDQRDLLRRLFEQAGCDVTVSGSANSAIRSSRAGDFTFDLAVIDLMLPGMAGWALGALLQSEHPDCPVVISSRIDPAEYPKAWSALPTPISLAGVREVLNTLARGWSGQAPAQPPVGHEVAQQTFSSSITLSGNSRMTAMVGRLVSKPAAPLLRQLPPIALYLFAIVLTLASPGVTVTNELAVVASGLGILIATIVATVLSRKESRWRLTLIVPAIDLGAVVALQFGTDATNSVFATFAFLLLIWFCMETGPQHIVLSVLGIALTVAYAFFVFLVHPTRLAPASEYLKDVFAFSVLCVVLGAIAITFLQEAHMRQQKSDLIARQAQPQLAQSRRHTAEMANSQALVRESDRLIRQLWEASTHQCSIGTDVTGLIDAWNPGAVRMLGLTSDQTVGVRHVDDFLLPTELSKRSQELQGGADEPGLHPGFAALVEPALRGPADVRDWTYVCSDGSLVAVELSVTARVDDNGETTGYLFVAHDLTKSNEVARLKDEFIGLISHELRTPLSSNSRLPRADAR